MPLAVQVVPPFTDLAVTLPVAVEVAMIVLTPLTAPVATAAYVPAGKAPPAIQFVPSVEYCVAVLLPDTATYRPPAA